VSGQKVQVVNVQVVNVERLSSNSKEMASMRHSLIIASVVVFALLVACNKKAETAQSMGVKLPMGVKFNRVLATFVGKEPGESGGPVAGACPHVGGARLWLWPCTQGARRRVH
jgi:hypothetical protein